MTTGSEPTPTEQLELLAHLIPLDWDDMTNPEAYVAWDNDLIAAANVALALGKPLLLTGDPGVGKSEFSNWLAYKLGLESREKFVVKSTTEASDLFYTYDTLGRFHEAQITNKCSLPTPGTPSPDPITIDPLRYIKYQALGLAILNSVGREHAKAERFVNEHLGNKISEHPRRTVVLIDEIDKAPRDVPNDVLDEIDKMAFSVKEIGSNELKSNTELRPVLVITSNSERDLPEPFLRRCIYYHIPFPGDEHLKRILLSRLHKRMAQTSPLLQDAQTLLNYLRSGVIPFTHKPGLAELLDWLYELTRDAGNRSLSLNQLPEGYAYRTAKVTLLKHAEDQNLATHEAWQKWLADAFK